MVVTSKRKKLPAVSGNVCHLMCQMSWLKLFLKSWEAVTIAVRRMLRQLSCFLTSFTIMPKLALFVTDHPFFHFIIIFAYRNGSTPGYDDSAMLKVEMQTLRLAKNLENQMLDTLRHLYGEVSIAVSNNIYSLNQIVILLSDSMSTFHFTEFCPKKSI